MKQKRAQEIKKMLCTCEECSNSTSNFDKLLRMGKDLEENKNLDVIERFTSAIASKERLIIINALKRQDRCVCELEAILNKSQSTISHHLRKLVAAGLIQGYKKQKFTYYHLFKEELKQNLTIFNQNLTLE
ncbi:MAG: winged helix-turn-helix transcriptional regulator [Candidatus Lokiarchaeota archaeon]|nr:winged helix-turn-helix transcriptional regulator [Candidatus Lokiarchaeota archaeon]